MRTVLAAVCVLAYVACGAGPTSPTSAPSTSASPAPPPQTAGVATVQGVVFHAPVLNYNGPGPVGPLGGAIVTVTEGPSAGDTSTTDANGVYHFRLSAGTFRLQWRATSYDPLDSDAMTAVADQVLSVPTVTLRPAAIPPWTVRGTVVDDVGNPVADALLFELGTGVSARSDAAGHYVLTSTLQHSGVTLLFRKSGYESQNGSPNCTGSCTTTANFRVLRILKEYLDVPSTVSVGDVFAVDDVREYRNGVSRLSPIGLTSNNPAVLEVQTANTYRLVVKARSAGTATLTLPACGSTAECISFTARLSTVSAVVRVLP
jgi:hypothetical protein